VRVHLESDFVRKRIDIWVFDHGDRLLRPANRAREEVWEEIEPNTGPKPAPSLSIREDVLEGIVAAASDHFPPSAATDRHLNDAIAIRDRLLILLEGKL
jgi:hypothetical protein